MSKHTPGPWKAVSASACAEIEVMEIAEVSYMRVIPASGGWPIAGTPEDDARLIAAAPELLEALRIAREIVVTERDAAHQGVVNPSTGVIDDHDDADWVAGYDRAMEQIDAAIAKATGEKA